MPKNRIIIILILITLFHPKELLSLENGSIDINAHNRSSADIPDEIFGTFVEFARETINGQTSMCAQELLDRGFDHKLTSFEEIPWLWEKFTSDSGLKANWQLDSGGYNLNGKYYQRLASNDTEDTIGIMQTVYLTDSVSHEGYIWCRSDDFKGELLISLTDTTLKKVIYRKEITEFNKQWTKHTFIIPPQKGIHRAKLIFSITGKGNVEIDEASLMPSNNVLGVRYEYYKLFSEWRPAIFRYPGGCFADTALNKLSYAVGDIDQRQSPNIYESIYSQRMDLGLDEFLQFCDLLKIKPHLVVNFENGTAEEAAQMVEYCNGDTNTVMGKLRKSNGHPEPYYVKYWEIGNEQWKFDEQYARRYLKFYDAMVSVDPDIKTIIDGCHWKGYSNFDTLMSVVGNKCAIFGYHPAVFCVPERHVDNDTIMMSMTACSNGDKYYTIPNYINWLKEKNLYGEVKQGATEWWTVYAGLDKWMFDRDRRNSSLESALSNAAHMNSYIRYPDSFVIAERTLRLGMFRCRIKKETGERIFFPTTNYYAILMMKQHHGKKLLETSVKSPEYSLETIPGICYVGSAKFLDAESTLSDDTLFISVINRSPYDSMKVSFNIDGLELKTDSSTVYELYSDSYLDCNDETTPFKILPRKKNIKFDTNYTFPEHSYSILAIPVNSSNDVTADAPFSQKVKIYPNPFENSLKISCLDDTQIYSSVTITNLFGDKIINFDSYLGNAPKIISTNLMPTGIYFVTVKSGRFTTTIKVIKN